MIYTNEIIESLLTEFKALLGKGYGKYRNHVYRVFTNCLLLDDTGQHQEKYAIASVFHDIGIWTNHTADYLNPSIAQVKVYLIKTGKEDCYEEISEMIYWHHKISRYKGSYEQSVEKLSGRQIGWTCHWDC